MGKSKKQSFGKRSTAETVARDAKLDGKNVIVTGANTGIGKETARVMAVKNANVFVACRDTKKGNDTVEQLKQLTGNSNIFFEQLDLSSLASVRDFAKRFNARNIPLHLLINNAGVMMPPYTKTADGFELQIGTNHIGHFVLTNLLLNSLKAGQPSRVVTVSSSAQKQATYPLRLDDMNWEKRTYGPWAGYCASKLANVLFAKELNRRMKEQGFDILAFAPHPGIITTDLWRHNDRFLGPIFKFFSRVISKTIPQGASTTIYAAVRPEVEEQGGSYLEDCKIVPTQYTNEDSLKLWEWTENAVAAVTPDAE